MPQMGSIRRLFSAISLVACTLILFGVWKMAASEDDPAAAPLAVKAPGNSSTRAGRGSPAFANVRRGSSDSARAPAAGLPERRSIRVGVTPEPKRSISIEVSEPYVIRSLASDKTLDRGPRLARTSVAATARG